MFYATLLYGEYAFDHRFPFLKDLPEGVFIYLPNEFSRSKWYLKDLTPVLLEDVPKPIQALALLMGLH